MCTFQTLHVQICIIAAEPKQRRKLNLAPRTKPLQQPAASEPTQKPVGSASIFGNAKPVDTTERDREIEEKLRHQQDRLLDDKDKKDQKDRSGDNSIERKPVSIFI